MRNGLNVNVIYRWLREEPQKTQTRLVTPTQASQVTSFLPVQLPQPVAKPVTVTASAEIRMELRRGGSTLFAQTPPRGFVDNSEYRVPHKPHRALLLCILSVKFHTE